MPKKPFVDDEKVKSLLCQYKNKNEYSSNKQQYNDIFVSLYNLMEPLLKWSITGNITKVYSPKIRNQKYYKLYKIQESFKNDKRSFKLNFSLASERYLKNYIEAYGYTNNAFPWDYSLIYPFWEILNKISLEKIQKSVGKYRNDYSYYLAVKFCDQYWNYIYRCVRRDLAMQMFSVDYIQHKSLENGTPYAFDKFQYQNNLYKFFNTDDASTSINKILTEREQQVLDLLIKEYTHVEIAEFLNISPENSRQIRYRIAKKVKKHIYQEQTNDL